MKEDEILRIQEEVLVKEETANRLRRQVQETERASALAHEKLMMANHANSSEEVESEPNSSQVL